LVNFHRSSPTGYPQHLFSAVSSEEECGRE